MSTLYHIKFKEIWGFLKNEDATFWLICIYLFFEYVRPQTIYKVTDVMPFAQTVLILTAVILFMKGNFFTVKNIENRLLFGYFIVIVVSSILALSPHVAFGKVQGFLVWMLIYCLIVNIVNTEKRFIVFILSFLLYSFKMAQFCFRGWVGVGFGFAIDGTGMGPGWFHNSGEFGIQMCMFFPLSAYFIIALKKYWPNWKKFLFLLFPLTALTGMISSSSRSAVLGGAAVLFWMLIKSKNRIKGMIGLAIIAFLFFQFLPKEQAERFQKMGSDRTSISRTERWRKGVEMVKMYPFFGVGFENWQVADRKFFGGSGAACHNIFIECMSELGYAGLTVFLLMILYTFVNNYKTRKLALELSSDNKFIYYMAHGLDGALIGYLTSGFFVTVLYYPYFWINLAMTVALNNVVKQEKAKLENVKKREN